MGTRREAGGGIARSVVYGTALLGLWRAALLLAAVLWVMPSCVHPAAHHVPPSAGCTHHAATTAPDLLALGAQPVRAEQDHPSDPDGPGGGDNCVAGPRGTGQALVPTPVPPPLPTEAPPPGAPRTADSIRAPPDRTVHALGLHQLQVLRT
ncbi:hypothetical protein HUT19_19500 [Streptomyces sp. NA02950]|uniref:hypothetical protein n=1 Tax=Streptomyces sp. NA02950 TaxID=2742137 RepID=UPI001590C63C|nr:hypothetical protein [Streptomyces sp. NA02950]QKV93673.1 hypothetical protein HUT19_19500 [Streptomyces sp. NA02950]